MPTYQYECSSCGHGFEILQSMKENRLRKCPECGQLKLQRLIGSGSGIIFKGTGFYETDYKRKPAGAAETSTAKSEKSKKASPSHGCSSNCGCAAG